ncbi:MAG: right-handed parallel beta-helix repeat-containing protein, partial [Chitinophagaceae bacterium]
YIPITFLGDSITVQQNFITNFCLVTDDGGGIYTSGNFDSKGRKLINNIILGGKGAHTGTNQPQDVAAHGIYMDDLTANVDITGNTVARCSEYGIFLHNASSITITGNTVFDCGVSQIGMNQDSQDPIRKISVRNNIFVSTKESQFITDMRSRSDDLAQFGSSDENFIYHPGESKPVARMYSPSAKKDMSLSSYQMATSQEQRSKRSGIVAPGNILFLYNPGFKDLTMTLKGRYKDLKGKVYPGKIVLVPFSSAVLIR